MAEGLSASDRKALIELVQNAQLVDAFGRLPKKQFMERPGDQARVAARVFEMRKRAGDLSSAFRERHADVSWDDLEKLDRTPEDLWRAAKKLVPKLLSALEPAIAEEPEAAFTIVEAPKAPRKRTRS